MERPRDPRTVVVVEGVSDQLAVRALARRRGRDLDREGIEIVVLGGAHAIGRFLGLVPRDVRVVGLCDAGEAEVFRRALARSGRPAEASVFVCVEDLEDELIRAVGAEAVQQALERHGDLGPFRTLQRQPEWRGRAVEDQLRRFMGSGGSRKTRYGAILVDALDLEHVPQPLDALLEHV